MEAENDRKTLEGLVEIGSLLYVLQIALDSECQPTKDTLPFCDLVKIIRGKAQALIEKLINEEIVKE